MRHPLSQSSELMRCIAKDSHDQNKPQAGSKPVCVHPCKTNTFSAAEMGHRHRHDKLDIEEFVTNSYLPLCVRPSVLTHERTVWAFYLFAAVVIIMQYVEREDNGDYGAQRKQSLLWRVKQSPAAEIIRLKLSHRTEARTNWRNKFVSHIVVGRM